MTLLDLLKGAAEGRDGIHISAQLRVDAMQLESYRIGWAAGTMNTAAAYIDKLENMLMDKPYAPKEAS